MKVFAADGMTLQRFDEQAGGQVVFHLHFHIIPRHDGVAMKPPASVKEDNAVLAEQAAKLSAALSRLPSASAQKAGGDNVPKIKSLEMRAYEYVMPRERAYSQAKGFNFRRTCALFIVITDDGVIGYGEAGGPLKTDCGLS